MKKMTKMAVFPVLMALGVGFSSMASAAYNCDAKRSAIEYQIQQAERYGNYNRVAGLKRALSEVNARCSTGAAVVDVQKNVEKLERKLLDKKEDLRDIKVDLRKAQAKGDAKAVAKYQRKLREKQVEIKEAAAELRQAKAELSASRK